MDHAPAAPTSAGGAARERYGTNRGMADAQVRTGGGPDRPWPEHAVGMPRADDGGVLSGGDGSGDAEGACRKIWVAASARGGISDTVPGLCRPAGSLRCVCDRADDRVEG